MALYGAIETLHDTEQNRTHPLRNILRDRQLKVNVKSMAQLAPRYVHNRPHNLHLYKLSIMFDDG